ncbi:hypothetical protein HWV62_37177 [Athelia sp. TMB]|nr:hypothetical protein HWV62_37177 [Athelia sp. TMB]
MALRLRTSWSGSTSPPPPPTQVVRDIHAYMTLPPSALQNDERSLVFSAILGAFQHWPHTCGDGIDSELGSRTVTLAPHSSRGGHGVCGFLVQLLLLLLNTFPATLAFNPIFEVASRRIVLISSPSLEGDAGHRFRPQRSARFSHSEAHENETTAGARVEAAVNILQQLRIDNTPARCLLSR